MSLKVRWILTLFGVSAIVALAIALVVGRGGSSSEDPAALLRANRRAKTFIARDERPHSARLLAGAAPRSALERAIGADLRRRVDRGELRGPAGEVRCLPVVRTAADSTPYRCVAKVGGFPYPFLGVVRERARRMTWCKVDSASREIGAVPVSPRCR